MEDANMIMVATKRWKLVHFLGGFRPMLFDLEQDPQELTDLGESADHAAILDEMYDHLLHWATRNSQRQTRSKQQIINMRRGKATGIVIGAWDESDMPERATLKYRNRTAPHWRDRHGKPAGPKSG